MNGAQVLGLGASSFRFRVCGFGSRVGKQEATRGFFGVLLVLFSVSPQRQPLKHISVCSYVSHLLL